MIVRKKQIESLSFERMSFGYERRKELLHDISLQIPLGKAWHVEGPSGHGQATFLRVLGGLSTPTSGAMLINGENVTEMSFDEFLPYRLDLGYTFQSGGLLSNRTLAENMLLPHLYHKLCSPEEAEAKIRAYAERFGFANMVDQRPAFVSAGLRKLVSVLRTLMFEPSFLVMDDPFSGFDQQTAQALVRYLREIWEDGFVKTMVFTTADNTYVSEFEASILRVENGKAYLDEKAAA
jgi:phospholipid/cholesterol/gamma-HCH transport system ATP-binding protein